MKAYFSDGDEVLAVQKTNRAGLSSDEAAKRLAENGKNRLQEGKKVPLILRFLKEFCNPMILVLLAAAAVSFTTALYSGESFADVVIILTVVVLNAVLGVLQESKAEKAIASLQKMTASSSRVLRGGKPAVVPSEELVCGDIVLLEAGDAVPADGRILECASLKIEESALTGESVPVEKTADTLSSEKGKVPLGDRRNMVYTGSTVVYGRGTVVVTATGMDTEMGGIASVLSEAKENRTPLQHKLAQLSKILTVFVLGVCAVIFAVNLFRLYPDFSGTALLDTFMIAVSLAVAAIPEGLAAVVTVVLSIGVTNMSKRNAAIRKLTAVETLGCAQIICSDKTGTLTQNKMTVVRVSASDSPLLASAMALCSDAELDENGRAVGEPTEAALVEYAFSAGLSKNDLKMQYNRIGEAPFDSLRKMMSVVCFRNGKWIQFTKGAPDEVLKKCRYVLAGGEKVLLTEERKAEILAENRQMAGEALRVLGAAYCEYESVPSSFSPDSLEQNLCFIGLAGMIDPVRPEVRDAVAQCREAGIRPVMITGDHLDTAVAIGKQLGIVSSEDQAVTGAVLDDLSDEELVRDIERYSVFARVQPEHKVRIVKAWQAKGKVTAMTGDGVNDAPSIKIANIGVGMGITGTDVTKNVADMVLADDNFATIVAAVGEGRRIYDNIRKSIQFLLASNLSEVFSVFAATLLGFTILKPVHLLWINLITDCFPALALGMEKPEPDIMSRPPRDAKEGIFAGGLAFDVLFQGIAVAVITLAAYLIGHFMESGRWEFVNSPDGMTMAFLALSLAEIFHSFNMRSRRKSVFSLSGQNLLLWGGMVLSLVCTTAVIYVPFLANAFGFESISPAEYAVAAFLAFLIVPVVETVKWFQRRFSRQA